MKRIKGLFFVVTITIGGCAYSSYLFSYPIQNTISIDRTMKQVLSDPVTQYIEESVTGPLQSQQKQDHSGITKLYLFLFLGISNVYSRLFAHVSKTFRIMAYYGLGKYILFKEYMKNMFLRAPISLK